MFHASVTPLRPIFLILASFHPLYPNSDSCDRFGAFFEGYETRLYCGLRPSIAALPVGLPVVRHRDFPHVVVCPLCRTPSWRRGERD